MSACEPHAEQHGEQERVQQRLGDVGVRLDLPPVVHDAEHGDDVDEPVQLRPLAPEPALKAARRGHRQRNQQHERREPDRDVRALRDVDEQRPPAATDRR